MYGGGERGFGRGRGGGGRFRGRGGFRGGRGGPMPPTGGPRGEGDGTAYAQERNGDYSEELRDRDRPPMLPLPSRPLTRVMARASAPGGANRQTSAALDQAGGQQQLQQQLPDAYRIEVNEYITQPGSTTNSAAGPAVPCVTVRDMRDFIADRKQRRVWIPVAVVEALVKYLKQGRSTAAAAAATPTTAAAPADSNNDNNKQQAPPYDVSALQPKSFECPVTSKRVDIDRVGDSMRLRTYMDVPSKEDYQEGDFIEVIELRNDLMNQLIKFLDDVATRYRPITGQASIPSLYSYSGERRFYFDLSETRWGVRLFISQVTEMHRNVIAIPMENVVAFRDRLNQVIEVHGLEENGGGGTELGPSRRRATSGGQRGNRGGGRGGYRQAQGQQREGQGQEQGQGQQQQQAQRQGQSQGQGQRQGQGQGRGQGPRQGQSQEQQPGQGQGQGQGQRQGGQGRGQGPRQGQGQEPGQGQDPRQSGQRQGQGQGQESGQGQGQKQQGQPRNNLQSQNSGPRGDPSPAVPSSPAALPTAEQAN